MRMGALRGCDAAVLLGRALRGLAAAADRPVRIVANEGRDWSSATFIGMRHRILLTARPGSSFDRWLATLPEMDVPLRGHIVADLTVEQVRVENGEAYATVLALTVAEA